MDPGYAPGAVLGVRDPDRSTRVVAYGVAGPDSVPVSPDAVFEIGSITETFTGTLLADMVLKGEVSLDEPVSRYLPDGVRMPSRNGREITLLDLATHQSALPAVPDDMRTPRRATAFCWRGRALAVASTTVVHESPTLTTDYPAFEHEVKGWYAGRYGR